MSRRLALPDGWYCDALASGEYAALITGSRIVTESGPLPLPGQDVLFLRLHRAGQFAGIGHDDDLAWQFTDGQWTTHGRAYGPNSVIYDATGQLVVRHDPPPSGFRYVAPDGRLVTAEDTYADPGRGLFEWTDLGELRIGQGPEDGCHVRFEDDGISRLLEAGEIRNVHVSRTDDLFAVSMVRQGRQSASIIHWLTLDELRALPPVVAPAPQPQPQPEPPAPTPVPTPQPTPGPPMPTDSFALLRQLNAQIAAALAVIDGRPSPAPTPTPTPIPPSPTPSPANLPTLAQCTPVPGTPPGLMEWPIATRLTLEGGGVTDQIRPRFDRADGPSRWPDFHADHLALDDTLQYTLGFVVQHAGTWYAATVVEFWHGRTESGPLPTNYQQDFVYDGRWAPLNTHTFRPGDVVGFFVCAGDLRPPFSIVTVRERSQIVWVQLNADLSGGRVIGNEA